MEPGQLKPWSGASSTDTRNNTTCPKCKAEPGNPCRSPSGKKTEYPHGERMQEFRRLFPSYSANRLVLNRFESQIPGFIKRQ
jgi:hypothetical protein